PAVEPISTAEAKLHLRVTQSAEDDYIDRLIKSARQQVESATGRALINQTWYLYLDGFPPDDRIRLPKAPLSSITSLVYTDSDGAATTFTADDWDADTNPTPGELVLVYNKQWPTPSALRPHSPIVVEYVAGYGAAGSSVPEPIRDAMYLLIGDAYTFRESLVTGTIVNTVRGVGDLFANYIVEAW
ncbi:MAG: head-tail connector protein, partial [Gemmatimonadales bacterium]|nr:head-tail connector protein [Gemmatimonadales bacterium]